MPNNIKDRLTAFALHLIISTLLIIVLLIAILMYWFPNQFIYAGGITGLKIIVGVDLVLGPALTLLVFNKEKASLKFDLAFIAVLQLSCMAAGVWLMHKERPIAQVLADDGIHIMSKADFDMYSIDLEAPKKGVHPAFFMLDLPEDWSRIPALKVATEFIDEKPFAYRDDLYLKITDLSQTQFSERIKKIQETTTKKINKTKSSEHECQWVPVISNHNSGDACVSFKKGIVILSNKNL